MKPEELFASITPILKPHFGGTFNTRYLINISEEEYKKILELIQQAKSEWQKEIAQKIIEYDNGDLTHYELINFAYEILNAPEPE